MAEIRIRKRRRLRNKEVKALAQELNDTMGMDVISTEDIIDIASSMEYDVIFVNGDILAIIVEGKPFLTVRGILELGADRAFVTVDMGAVPYVANGADVMAPGVVDADLQLEEGNMVWIRDEKNARPLAIGKALMSGSDMISAKSGKAVVTIHYVGDKLWKYDEK
jgi:PUA-domain protein